MAGAYFLVSSFSVPIYFVPLSQGDEEQSSGGGMFLRSPLIRSPLTVVFLQTPPSLRATSPNLGEESGWGPVSGFRFHVSIHYVPLR